jgi:hypothetical protein
MFTRKVMIGLVLASLSAGAMAQQSSEGKTDIFGRPYVNETPLQVYYQSDPLGPLPQIVEMRQAQREAAQRQATNAAANAQAASGDVEKDIFGRPQINETANEVYFSADPFSPLPQLQPEYRSLLAQGTAAPTVASAGTKTDVFGRPDSGWNGTEAYYDINPFAPLPQFWNRDVQGVGAVASKPADTQVSSAGSSVGTHAEASN